MAKATIYVIKSPITNDIVYVGQTMNYKVRVSCHLSAKGNSAISRYICYLKNKGLSPIFEIYKTCMDWNRWSVEDAVIKSLRNKHRLLNTSGNGHSASRKAEKHHMPDIELLQSKFRVLSF